MSDEATTGRHEFARKLLIDLSVMTIVGVILALIGPFGSADAPLAVRLVSWLLFAWVGYAVYNPIGWAVEQLHRSLHLPEIGLWIAGCLIATIPMTAIVWAIGFWPRPVPMPTGEQALEAYINVLIIGASITVLFHLIERSKQAPPAAAAERPAAAARTAPLDAPAPQPAFLERLPGHLGTDLIALEMEDHYVRAHTALGSELILMRMRDAVAELQGVEGAQVHRSWWVAREHVRGVDRDGRKMGLELANGMIALALEAFEEPRRT